MPQPSKPKFSENEKVLCFHGPLLYEAKLVKSKRETKAGAAGEFQYFVHYLGWNKNWDEWVAESRILKINSETLERKTKLMQAHVATTKDRKKSGKGGKLLGILGGGGGPLGEMSGGSGGRRSESANTSRASTPVSEKSVRVGGKRPLADDEQSTSSREEEPSSKTKKTKGGEIEEDSEEENEEEEEDEEETRFKIVLPEELKFVLVSDWDLVVHKKSLFNLPAKISAASIIGEFVKHVEKTQKAKALVAQEVMLGVKDFFNEVIERELLYKLERSQYQSVRGDNGKPAVEVYGSAHLLRLMVKMNSLLEHTTISAENDVMIIEGIIVDFLTYLETNRQKFFTSKNYVEAPQEYLKTLE